MPDTLEDHRRAKLTETLRFLAEQSPFYQPFLTGMSIAPDKAPGILRTLPVLRTADWQENRHLIRTSPLSDVTLGYTSGTTGSHHAFVLADDEIAAFDQARGGVGHSERTLRISRVNHGHAAFAGLGSGCVAQPVLLPEQFEQAALILERTREPFTSFDPIRHLQGTLGQVRQLTLYLLHRRGRVDDLGVEHLTVGRHFLSPRWRRRLQEWWGAEVQVVYGCSELSVCNAAQCLACGYFHLPPSCLGEVVSMDDQDQPVAPGGRGAILLTAFFPFVRVEPRIRYRPGDLVEISDELCPVWSEHGFRPLGRERDAMRLPESQNWVSVGDFFDAVADIPEVARTEHSEAGDPVFTLKLDPGPTLNVGLCYDPIVWPEEADQVRRTLASKIGFPEVAVAVHGPGKL